MRNFLNRIGSIRWTLAILLLLAGTSAFGTFLPPSGSMDRYERLLGAGGARAARILGLTDIYHSPWIRGLLVFLALNLLACMIKRVPDMVSSLRGETAPGLVESVL